MPRIVVHCRAHAEAAVAAAEALGVAVTLVSPPAAAAYMGPAFFLEMVRDMAPPHDAVLDCGHAPGHALAALRQGVKAIRVAAASDVLARIADIAAKRGARVDTAEDSALDLEPVPESRWLAACHDWLRPTGGLQTP